jgi:hypothetical protein
MVNQVVEPQLVVKGQIPRRARNRCFQLIRVSPVHHCKDLDSCQKDVVNQQALNTHLSVRRVRSVQRWQEVSLVLYHPDIPRLNGLRTGGTPEDSITDHRHIGGLVGGDVGLGRREFYGSNGQFALCFIQPLTVFVSYSPLD